VGKTKMAFVMRYTKPDRVRRDVHVWSPVAESMVRVYHKMLKSVEETRATPLPWGVVEVERLDGDFGSRAVPPFSRRFDAEDRCASPNVIGDRCGGPIVHFM